MHSPLWQPDPDRAAQSQMHAFMEAASLRAGRRLADYRALHRWSIEAPAAFWRLVWETCGVIGEPGEKTFEPGARMQDARFFPDARLNFAENLLRRRDEATAIVAWNECGERRSLSFAALYREVAMLAAGLRGLGVAPGDRVAGYLPNLPETVVAMLAATSLGATWSSCSPDFGTAGVVDRLAQIEPKILFAADGYVYSGKRIENLGRIAEILDTIPSVQHCVVVPYLASLTDSAQTPEAGVDGIRNGVQYASLLRRDAPDEIAFARLPFDHPLYIMFSSGTTGKPKCIVHGAGGSLLQHLKEHRLHCDLRPEERFFYFTTCGWMMWNWLVSGLASEATLVLYEGAPTHPGAHVLFEIAERERIGVFGTSAKFIDALAKSGERPGERFDLGSIRMLLSTGSPLVPEGFDYVYAHVKGDVHLASISGGTDILSCFVLGNPLEPVFRGEIQGPGLGMRIEIYDDAGRPTIGETGELVCSAPFPSMPTGFFGDDDGSRYHAAYFERFDDVWCHGDFTLETEHGGYVITGRSDAVLNPGGVRIGTAEIYRQVEALEEVVESIAIGQPWQGDVRVVLFVKLRPGAALDDALVERIRTTIRENATPRHVPARVLAVEDIPRTRSGKITELAVRQVVTGGEVKNVEALANPEALEHFRDRPELRT